MSGLVHRSFDKPDEVRAFEDGAGHLDLVNLGEGAVGRSVFGAGWQWSKHVRPIAGTDSCQGSHAGYVISGRLHVQMDDGTSEEFGPGDLMVVPPGHDAWTLGDEDCVMLDWQGVTDYARRQP